MLLIIGLTIGLLFLLVFIVSPKKALLLLFATRTFIDLFTHNFVIGYIGPWRLNLQTLIGGEFIVLCLFYFLRKGKIKKSLFLIPIVCFSLISLISLIFLDEIENIMIGINTYFRWFSMFLLILLIIETITKKIDIDKIINSTIFASFIPIAISFYGIISRKGTAIFYSSPNLARVGLYSPGNPTGLILLSLLPFVFLKSINYCLRYRNIFRILTVSLLIGIIFTFTRTAWLGFISFFIIFSILSKKIKYFLYSFIIFILLIFLNPFISEVTWQRFIDFKYTKITRNIESLGEGRLGIWIRNIIFWNNLPLINKLFGSGIGSNVYATMDYGSHNDFIMLLVDTGVIGLFFYCYFLLKLLEGWILLLRKAQDSYYRNLAYTGISLFATFILMSFVNGQLQMMQSQWYIAGFLALGHAALRIIKQEELVK